MKLVQIILQSILIEIMRIKLNISKDTLFNIIMIGMVIYAIKEKIKTY